MASMASSDHLVPIKAIHIYGYLFKWFTIHLTDPRELTLLSRKPVYAQTFAIEKYPSRVYLIDYDELTNRIRIWLQEREAHVAKCSDYMHEKYSSNDMDPCWVCKWVDINSNWLINPTENLDESSIIRPDIYRLHGDREVSFGDGGYAFLVYPVWIHDQFPVKESRRKRLLDVLYQLNYQRKDFHSEPSPVEDIIDPDLLSCRPPSFDRNRWADRQKKLVEHNARKSRCFNRDLADGAYDDLSEHEKLRDTYQWLPSEFVIDTNGHVDIRTPINHLPVLPEYRQAYGDIAQIFHAMLPMFERLKIIQQNSDHVQRLQVIVKAQSYNLKAGMKYSGRWHTEGQTENIVAVGVFYLHIDEELEGGSLKFRPKYGPQSSYASIETDHFVLGLKTGAAIAFSNSIPHRFEQIQNLTPDDNRRRTFLNFFIIDPDQPIQMQSDRIIRAPQDHILDALQQWSQGRLPDLVLEKILKYIGFSLAWQTGSKAKEFRASVRRAMLQEKSGWGWICWGNCGTTEFVRALCVVPSREREEMRDELHHSAPD